MGCGVPVALPVPDVCLMCGSCNVQYEVAMHQLEYVRHLVQSGKQVTKGAPAPTARSRAGCTRLDRLDSVTFLVADLLQPAMARGRSAGRSRALRECTCVTAVSEGFLPAPLMGGGGVLVPAACADAWKKECRKTLKDFETVLCEAATVRMAAQERRVEVLVTQVRHASRHVGDVAAKARRDVAACVAASSVVTAASVAAKAKLRADKKALRATSDALLQLMDSAQAKWQQRLDDLGRRLDVARVVVHTGGVAVKARRDAETAVAVDFKAREVALDTATRVVQLQRKEQEERNDECRMMLMKVFDAVCGMTAMISQATSLHHDALEVLVVMLTKCNACRGGAPKLRSMSKTYADVVQSRRFHLEASLHMYPLDVLARTVHKAEVEGEGYMEDVGSELIWSFYMLFHRVRQAPCEKDAIADGKQPVAQRFWAVEDRCLGRYIADFARKRPDTFQSVLARFQDSGQEVMAMAGAGGAGDSATARAADLEPVPTGFGAGGAGGAGGAVAAADAYCGGTVDGLEALDSTHLDDIEYDYESADVVGGGVPEVVVGGDKDYTGRPTAMGYKAASFGASDDVLKKNSLEYVNKDVYMRSLLQTIVWPTGTDDCKGAAERHMTNASFGEELYNMLVTPFTNTLESYVDLVTQLQTTLTRHHELVQTTVMARCVDILRSLKMVALWPCNRSLLSAREDMARKLNILQVAMGLPVIAGTASAGTASAGTASAGTATFVKVSGAKPGPTRRTKKGGARG